MRSSGASLALVLALALAGCASAPQAPVPLTLLAINDFHGNLKPPLGGVRIQDTADRTKTVAVAAGGAEHLATAIAELKAKSGPNTVVVGAGDLVGASPLLSALFRDEPAIEALSMAGLQISAVGNHEFDRGAAELLRLQRGGCVPEGCKGPEPFKGAAYTYLAASTIDTRTGQPLLPAYVVRRFGGIAVGFIGLTTKQTPELVVPSGVAGLRFEDEASTVNALVPELKAQGVNTIVVLIHEGGQPSGDYNECPGIAGEIVGIVKRLDPAVKVVVSGHTHRAYNCRIDGRLVTSADKYGTMVTKIDLVLDPRTGDVAQAQAENVIVRTATFAKDARLTQLIATYEKLAVPLARRVVGTIGAPLSRELNAAGEMPVGQVIADAQLAATRDAGAQLALMNQGGVRAPIARAEDGRVRYEDLFTVQPFSNNLVTLTLTGAELAQLLEQQFASATTQRFLQVSEGFGYTWDASQPAGRKVVPGSLTLDGRPVGANDTLRVTVNGFLAAGGDGFTVLTRGRDARTGLIDVDALERYVAAHPNLQAPAAPRVKRLN